VIAAGAGLNHRAADLAVLGAALLVSTAVGLYLLADSRSAPSGFPWSRGYPMPVSDGYGWLQAERSGYGSRGWDHEAEGSGDPDGNARDQSSRS
jgi:hypothetical protein